MVTIIVQIGLLTINKKENSEASNMGTTNYMEQSPPHDKNLRNKGTIRERSKHYKFINKTFE